MGIYSANNNNKQGNKFTTTSKYPQPTSSIHRQQRKRLFQLIAYTVRLLCKNDFTRNYNGTRLNTFGIRNGLISRYFHRINIFNYYGKHFGAVSRRENSLNYLNGGVRISLVWIDPLSKAKDLLSFV